MQAAPIPRWQWAYVAACAGAIGFCLLYWIADFARLPRVFIDPQGGAWRIYETPPSSAPMGYVGLILWGFAGAAAAAALACAVLRFLRRPLADRGLALSLAWTLTALLFSGAYFTWHNWP